MSFDNLTVRKGVLPPNYEIGKMRPEDFTPPTTSGAKEEFLGIARQTPAERMREALLKRMGVTEDELKAMKPEERTAIEDQVSQLIQQDALTDPTQARRAGRVADVRA